MEGYEIFEASSAAQALELFAQCSFALAILDMRWINSVRVMSPSISGTNKKEKQKSPEPRVQACGRRRLIRYQLTSLGSTFPAMIYAHCGDLSESISLLGGFD
jgi:hypothetical protein